LVPAQYLAPPMPEDEDIYQPFAGTGRSLLEEGASKPLLDDNDHEARRRLLETATMRRLAFSQDQAPVL